MLFCKCKQTSLSGDILYQGSTKQCTYLMSTAFFNDKLEMNCPKYVR